MTIRDTLDKLRKLDEFVDPDKLKKKSDEDGKKGDVDSESFFGKKKKDKDEDEEKVTEAENCTKCDCDGECKPDCSCGCKAVNEAQINLSITDLQSQDAETLSQMLHLAGVAETPTMGMDDVYSDPMADPMGMDMEPDMGMDPEMGMDMDPEMGMDDPMSGDEIMPSDMDALGMEPEPEMGGDDPMDMGMGMDLDDEGGDDLGAALSAELGGDDEEGMGMEPADEPVVDMSPEDDAVVLGDYAEESLDDMLRLAGMDILPEEDDALAWANEPDVKSSGEPPSEGPNRKSKLGNGARPGDNPMAVEARAEQLKAKLAKFK